MYQVMTSTSMGLPNLEWQTYEVTVGTTPTRLLPAALVISNVVATAGTGLLSVTIAGGGAGVLKWLRPGMCVSITGITAATTYAGLMTKYLVDSITVATGIVSLKGMRGKTDFNGAVATGAPAGSPVLNLLAAHAQKAYVRVPAAGATITLSPNSDALLNSYGWNTTIAASAERELFAPAGGKFDLNEWVATVAASTQKVLVLFV